MSRPHWHLVAVVVAGLTILSVPGYAQITVEAVGVSALTTARQTERLLVELTREGGNSTDHVWRVRQASRQGSASDQGFCSVCGVLTGAGLGFAAHESGHLVANWALGTDVYVKKVEGLRVPFFAIAHRDTLSRRQEFIVSSAGLWAQFAVAEWVLTRNPRLRSQRASLKKGVLAFHVATSVLYGVGGLGRIGPPERDTRGMAMGMGGHERWVGIGVLTPGVLDAYRYFHPSATWARWASRVSKMVLLIPLLR
jgi:hypothetical protein